MTLLPKALFLLAIVCTAHTKIVYDLSHQMQHEMPNLVNYLLDFNQSGINSEFGVKRQSFCALENAGTHVNAPFKVDENRRTISEIPISHLIAPLVVVSSTTTANVTILKNWEKTYGEIPEGSVVALRSRQPNPWKSGKDAYLGITPRRPTPKYAGFELDACHYLVSKHVVGVGIDTLAIDGSKIETHSWPCQSILAENDIYVLENLNLDDVPKNGTIVFVGALNLDFGTGSPARVLVLDGSAEMTPTNPPPQNTTTAAESTPVAKTTPTVKQMPSSVQNNSVQTCYYFLLLFLFVFELLL